MFDYTKMEIVAGVFVVLGLAALGYLSISIGGLRIRPAETYRVSARFSDVGGLKAHASVKIAGVTIGRVESIRLADYYGQVELAINRNVPLPRDTMASIATTGLLGDSHVALSPGSADANLADGDRISHTEPAINITDIIGRTAFGTAGAAPRDAGVKP